MIKFIIFSLFFTFSVLSESLRVGIAGSVPFRISEPKVSGISLDIWEKMAEMEKWDYTVKEYPNISALIEAVNRGEMDVGIGPITVTSKRLESVSFSQPYYSSHKAILVKRGSISPMSFVKTLFEETFFYAIGILFCVLFLVGNLILLSEKGVNPAFQLPYFSSIGNAMWLAVVTFSTVGYGDITPKTKTGKLIIASWMVISMITASSLTAGIAASFTLSRIQNHAIDSPEDMKERRISAILGSTGEEIVKAYKGYLVSIQNAKEGIESVRDNKADGFIGDYPIIKYNLENNAFPTAAIVEFKTDKDSYGFCMSKGNRKLERVNHTLLILEESGTINSILQKWGL